jgi:hypothetical protein
VFNQSITDISIFSNNNKNILFILLPVYYIFSEFFINNVSDRIINREYQKILINELEKKD